MVTQTITSAARLAQGIAAATEALRQIRNLRKEVTALRRDGMSEAANCLSRECDYNERRIRNGLTSMLRSRQRSRTTARRRRRDASGRFS